MPNSKKLRISGPAKTDLQRIADYTRREWGTAQKRKYLGQIKDTFKAIRDTPVGTPRDEIDKGLRTHPVRRHVIFYRETKNELLIVRVLHASMDPERHLGTKRQHSSGV